MHSMNISRMIAREVARSGRRTAVYRRMQREAAARPGSTRVQTPTGEIWMSPIEVALYDAMRREGLARSRSSTFKDITRTLLFQTFE